MQNKRFLIAFLVALIAVSLSYFYLGNQKKDSGEKVGKKESSTDTSRPMSEKERLEYVSKFITVDGITIEPDTQIGPDGKTVIIEGLMRVKGDVSNSGERNISKVLLLLLIKDEQDKVIATDLEDILQGRQLDAKDQRNFSFKIRDRKEFSGRYDIRLK
ncbi:MAG: hypothetical protein VYC39_07195 [Myxococcota bacterium]|nr:hypothetical protein [Myxococcota bacterium]